MNKKVWSDPKYQRIVSANTKGDDLEVKFEDGATIILDKDIVVPIKAQSPDWTSLQFNPYELILPTSSGEIEIPWSNIRLLSDSNFAAYWAQKADEEANDVGQRIRALRQSKNLSSKEVAERAGITPQSLSRIEKGHHDVVFATLKKLLTAMGCTLQDLASVQVSPVSINSIFSRLTSAGLKKDWLINRILPKKLLSNFDATVEKDDIIDQITNSISKIYNWPKEEILGDNNLVIDSSLVQGVIFKNLTRSENKQVQAYTLYAHYISLLVVQATSHLEIKSLPDNPEEIKDEIINKYGPLNLENILRYVWDHGIPVIPLSDAGAFHGAALAVSGRKVIVLKQLTKYQARWLFDLLHELGHVVKHLDSRGNIIEANEISPFDDHEIEKEANEFAAEMLFAGQAEKLVDEIVRRAGGKVEALKSATLQIAAEEHFPVDVLANYLAFRVTASKIRINWWGTANNLQVNEPSPFVIARQIFNEKVKLDLLNIEDQNMLVRALEN